MDNDWIKAKSVLVTGGSSGIGFEAAKGLAALGARVSIASRNFERTKDAAQNIAEATGAKVAAYQIDLSSQASTRAFAEKFRAANQSLDVLINNAGALFTRRLESVDGIEMTWALNHLGPFLLTAELLPLLKAAGAGRIINVASNAHEGASIHFDDPEFKNGGYGAFRAYSQSKLANVMFTYALARRLAGSSVTTNCVHPGVVASGFLRNIPIVGPFAHLVTQYFMISEAQGAENSIQLAASPELAGRSGLYFVKNSPKQSNAASRDEVAQERLWDISLAETGATY